MMDRINDKQEHDKICRIDRRKKRMGTRIKAALLAGLAGVVLVNAFPGQIRDLAVQHRNQAAVSAWWGTIYPKFCFADVKKDGKDSVKISLWLAQALDW